MDSRVRTMRYAVMRSRPVCSAISSMVHSRWSTSNRPRIESPRTSALTEKGSVSRDSLLAAISPPRTPVLSAAPVALQLGVALRYDSYDTINIIQQYRDIVLSSLELLTDPSRSVWGRCLMAEKVFANLHEQRTGVGLRQRRQDRAGAAPGRRPGRLQALDHRGRRQEVLAAEEAHALARTSTRSAAASTPTSASSTP